jgi:hypothetical protein
LNELIFKSSEPPEASSKPQRSGGVRGIGLDGSFDVRRQPVHSKEKSRGNIMKLDYIKKKSLNILGNHKSLIVH